jgi:DNA-binding MarR family transcriptional regulator
MSSRSAREVRRVGVQPFLDFVAGIVLYAQVTAEAAGLGVADAYCLTVLRSIGPITAGRLAELAGLTTGATTRLIDRVERRGYVRRVRHPSDRRKVMIETVPERLAEWQLLKEPARRELGEVFASYTPEELDILIDFFTRAAPALRAAAIETRTGAARVEADFAARSASA